MYTQKGELIHTALLILNVGSNWGGVGQHRLRPFYPREEGPLTIVEEAGWVPGPVWTVVTGVEEECLLCPPKFEPRTFQPCMYICIYIHEH
jgi:hypothetical protein